MSLATFLKHEAKELVVISVFFFSGFLLIFAVLELMLEDYDIHFNALAKALIGALVLAKVILVLRGRAFMQLFPNSYGIVRVLYKTLIYMAGVFVVVLLDKIIESYREAGGVQAALEHLVETRRIHRVAASILVLGVQIAAFNCWEEVLRQVGRDRLVDAFLRRNLPARNDT